MPSLVLLKSLRQGEPWEKNVSVRFEVTLFDHFACLLTFLFMHFHRQPNGISYLIFLYF